MKHILLSLVIAAIAFLSPVAAIAQTAKSTNQDAKPQQSIALSAYSRVAPFVNPETFFVVRIDLDTLDSDAFLKTIDDVFVGFLKEQGFETKNVLGVNRDFRRALDELKVEIDALLAFKSLLKIREIFILIQNQKDESFRVFIPFSASNREAAKSSFEEFVSAHDAPLKLVDLPGGLGITNNVEADKKRYANLEIRPNAALKKFFERTAGSTVQVYVSYLKLRTLFQDGLGLQPAKRDASTLPSDAVQAFDAFDSNVQETTLTFDANTLTLKGEVVFITADKAKTFREGLEKFVSHVIDQYFDANPEETRDLLDVDDEVFDKYNLANLSREFTRASAIKLLPTQSGAVLNLEISPQKKDLLHNSCFWQILFIPLVTSEANDQ